MITRIALGIILFASAATAQAAADERTAGMLRKADEILRGTMVVSGRAVGYAGVCPEANWALSVICASKDDPAGHLVELADQCHPAGFVMCMLGLRLVDEKRFADELAKRRMEIEVTKPTVETASGCLVDREAAIKVLEQKGWDRDGLLCDPLPELWETVRVYPIVDSIEGEMDHILKLSPSSPRG